MLLSEHSSFANCVSIYVGKKRVLCFDRQKCGMFKGLAWNSSNGDRIYFCFFLEFSDAKQLFLAYAGMTSMCHICMQQYILLVCLICFCAPQINSFFLGSLISLDPKFTMTGVPVIFFIYAAIREFFFKLCFFLLFHYVYAQHLSMVVLFSLNALH